MKKLSAMTAAIVMTLAATAQTLNVNVGNVSYQFPASETGQMTFAGGTTLTVMDNAFTLTDIDSITVHDSKVTDNLVSIEYSTSGNATVKVPANVIQYVSATVSGNHVTIVQSNTDAVDDDEITYQLTGNTTDGSLTLDGSYKCTISLAGVTLTNPDGAAIMVTNKKRIQLSAKNGTVNTLTDGAGSQKACIYSKGQLQLQGKGTLNVCGNTAHGIKSASYIYIKNLTLNVTSAVSDAINCEEYFQMASGTVTLSGLGGDGIQCDLGGDSSTGQTTDHEDEDTGNIYLEGGTLTVTTDATAAKCIKCDGSISVTDGTIVLNANGGVDTSDTSDLSYCCGLKADGDFTQTGGSITVNVNGAAGRGVGVDGTFSSPDSNTGTLTIINKGALVSSGSTYFATAKGIKAGVVAIDGGTIHVTVTGAVAKGIQSDSDDGSGNLTITGGTVKVTSSGAGAYDGTEMDAKGSACLKSDVNMVISGGTLTLQNSGTGGKAIKASGTLTVSGGSITAASSGSQYKYSSSYTASAKGIKSDGAMTITGGEITASSSSHEGIETKGALTISNGYVYSCSSDDAINSAGNMTISGGYVMAYSTGNDGLDANGNMYIKGGNIYAVSASGAEVALDAAERYTLSITGGNLVAVGGLEKGASISNGTAYQASSYSKNTWYALYNGSSSVAFAFKVPNSSNMGTPMVVYTTGSTSLYSGVTGSDSAFWNGYGYSNCSGGSSVSLSSYSSNSSGGPHF